MGVSIKDLNIWRKGYSLVLAVYKVTSMFPQSERYGLTDQVRRSSNSIIALIAEEHGRFHYQDKCRVLYQARGECYETMSHLQVARGLKYLSESDFDKLYKEYEGLGAGINAYIKSIQKNKS